MSARTATQAMAEIRLILAQVVSDARDASGIVAFQWRRWRKATARQRGTCEGFEAQTADGVPSWVKALPCGDGILVRAVPVGLDR